MKILSSFTCFNVVQNPYVFHFSAVHYNGIIMSEYQQNFHFWANYFIALKLLLKFTPFVGQIQIPESLTTSPILLCIMIFMNLFYVLSHNCHLVYSQLCLFAALIVLHLALVAGAYCGMTWRNYSGPNHKTTAQTAKPLKLLQGQVEISLLWQGGRILIAGNVK